MTEEQKIERRGGNRKGNAPPHFYTAQQAQQRLHLSKSSFYYYVETGVIQQIHVPPRKEGYYAKKDIDMLAASRVLANLAHMTEEERTPTEFRTATPEDADGIYEVLISLEWPATPASLRRLWYAANPEIDHIVLQDDVVMGYINAVPYDSVVMEEMLSGHKKGWDIRPSDILPFEAGHTYDLFFGLAERAKPDKKSRYARYGRRLVLGFFNQVIEEWARRDIFIHRLLAHTDEDDGRRLAKILGFERQPAVPGDRYVRYVLNLLTSPLPFARRYQVLVNEIRERE